MYCTSDAFSSGLGDGAGDLDLGVLLPRLPVGLVSSSSFFNDIKLPTKSLSVEPSSMPRPNHLPQVYLEENKC